MGGGGGGGAWFKDKVGDLVWGIKRYFLKVQPKIPSKIFVLWTWKEISWYPLLITDINVKNHVLCFTSRIMAIKSVLYFWWALGYDDLNNFLVQTRKYSRGKRLLWLKIQKNISTEICVHIRRKRLLACWTIFVQTECQYTYIGPPPPQIFQT